MWGPWETPSLPKDYICTRCIEMRLLKDRVRELELEIDDLRLIRESEEVIDTTYREVVDSTPVTVPLRNRYIVLDTVEEADLTEQDHSERDSGILPSAAIKRARRNAVVIGDSIVRGTDKRFCEPDKDTRMVCCLPGARVRDVSDRVQSILRREGEQPEVLVHVGTNDMDRKREEVLKKDYWELGRKLKSRTSRVIISGLLPELRANDGKNSRIKQMNVWLSNWCRGQGFKFLDHWDLFWGRYDLYKNDGLHLNSKGTNILAGLFNIAVREGLN